MRALLLAWATGCAPAAPPPDAPGLAPDADGLSAATGGAVVRVGWAEGLGGTPPQVGPCHAWPGEACVSSTGPDGRSEARRVPGGLALAWRVDRATADPLAVDVAWPGVTWRGDDAGLVGRAADGRVWLHGPATAWDADGRPLVTHLAPARSGVRVTVDAADARLPVTIDPVVSSPAWSWTTTLEGVHAAGDVNADGHDDLVVFSRGGTTTSVGTAWLVPGTASGPDTAAAVALTAAGATWEFGRAAATAGDVDGDGIDDLAVGDGGVVFVWAGDAAGLDPAPSWRLDAPAGGTGFGFAVATAGDVDADGYDDLLVGDPTLTGQVGAAWLFRGSATGPSATPDTRLDGDGANAWFGIAVGPAGDVDADGYDDVIVGAANAASIQGYAAVYHGGAAGLSTTETTRIVGSGAGSTAGRSVDGAGDVNGDGYDDVVIGIPGDSAATGATGVYLGSASGVSTAADTWVTGAAVGAKLGTSVSAAGDVDGDGFADVVTGGHGTVRMIAVLHGSPTGAAGAGAPAIVGAATFGKWVDGGMDVDGDGLDDVVVADPGSNLALWYPGDVDRDGDGWSSREDCDDTDDAVGPAAVLWPDADGDGWGDDATPTATCAPTSDLVDRGGDCDDTDGSVHPDAAERPGDRVDQDCDGREACFLDLDGDGARGTGVEADTADLACDDPGHARAEASLDCDDADAATRPGAPERCDGVDRDCDGVVDAPDPVDAPAWFRDEDGDGFGAGDPVAACDPPDRHVEVDGDCDDADPAASPAGVEIAGDGVDQDCDGRDAAAPTPADTAAPRDDAPPARKAPSGCAHTGGLAPGLALLAALLVGGRRRAEVLHPRA